MQKERKMATTPCPLDGVLYQKLCSDHQNLVENGSIGNCAHKEDCSRLKGLIENDKDNANWVAKALLINGIPNNFDEPNKSKDQKNTG